MPNAPFNGTRFQNLEAISPKKLSDVLRWKRHHKAEVWLPQIPCFAAKTPARVTEGVHVTWIGHSTFLIQTPTANWLTDPVWAERTSPISFLGPKRARPPALALVDLPPIDFVVVSHNHYDHLDLKTLKKLNQLFKPEFVLPLRHSWLRKHGITRLHELDWWQTVQLDCGAEVTAAPAQHWSRRGLNDTNQSLWMAAQIKLKNIKNINKNNNLDNNFQVYFAGDTGYAPHFAQTREKLDAPDLALLPIGAYEPRWFMRTMHMNPSDAAQAHLDLGARASLAMHFGTFQLTDEGFDTPILDLAQSLNQKNIDKHQFCVPILGETKVYGLDNNAQ